MLRWGGRVFDFLNHLNFYPLLVFKKNFYFKSKPWLNNLNLSPLEYFLMDRFMQHQELMQDPNSWTVDKVNKTAFFKYPEKIMDLTAQWQKFKNQDLSVQINQLLVSEYGESLPEFTDGEWEIVEVELGKLLWSQSGAEGRISPEIIEDYSSQIQSGRELIGGVFRPVGDNFKLVDGYHRLAALKNHYAPPHLVQIISFRPNSF